MKFNMGCGNNKRPGHINVDAYQECAPDVVWNLEKTPWPWEDNCAELVVFNHALEHMGQDPQVFLNIMKELYRICEPDAQIHINVPHPRHDFFIGDPTHVRPITPEVLSLFNKEQCDSWKASGASNTPFAHYLGVNFKLTSLQRTPDTPYKKMLDRGEITTLQLKQIGEERNNVFTEYRFVLRAIK